MEQLFKDPFKYCTFYLVRHGETVWNVERKAQGQSDSPLTEKGKEQARETAKILKDIKFDAIFSSNLGRALKTAEILKAERNLEIKATNLLREGNFGKFEGRQIDTFRELDLVFDNLSNEGKLHFKMDKESESNAEMIARFITFLRETAIFYKGKKVLAITHGAILRVLLIHLGFGSYENFGHDKKIKNSAYIKLLSDGVDFFIEETFGIDKPS